MRFVVSLCCLLAMTACDERVTGPTAPLNTEFTLAPGETVALERASLSVRFNRITGDNRCPADALCVLGGSADVSITANSDRATHDYVLRTGDLQPVQHDPQRAVRSSQPPRLASSKPRVRTPGLELEVLTV